MTIYLFFFFFHSGEENWTQVQNQVLDLALTLTSAWMIGLDGKICLQTQLTEAQVDAQTEGVITISFVF